LKRCSYLFGRIIACRSIIADNASANFLKIIGKKIIANILLILDKYEFIKDENLIKKNKPNVDKKNLYEEVVANDDTDKWYEPKAKKKKN